MAAKKIKEDFWGTEIVYAHIPGGGETLCKDRGFDRNYWMADIYDNLKDKPLGKIVYPGSHDAGAYNFTTEKVVGVKDILFDIRINPVATYRQVQLHPIGKQMQAGCRYFDLRIVKAKDNRFHCQHSFVAEDFGKMLAEIKEYLDKGKALGKRELIILHVSNFSNNKRTNGSANEQDEKDFRSMVERMIGEYLYKKPVVNAQRKTYGSFFEDMKPCVLLYGACYPKVNFGNIACAQWPNSSNNKDIRENERKCHSDYISRPAADGYRMHFTSTYQLVDEIIPGETQLSLVKSLNRELCLLEYVLLGSLRQNGMHLINIIYLDSPATSPAAVYARNMNLMIKYEKRDTFSVLYQTHIEKAGWRPYARDGGTSGTVGKHLRMEAISIRLEGPTDVPQIEYEVYVENRGWQKAVRNGETAGTTGKSLRTEAIRIRLIDLPGHSVKYRVHVQEYGWMDWVKDGEIAGILNKSKRIEAIEIMVDKHQ